VHFHALAVMPIFFLILSDHPGTWHVLLVLWSCKEDRRDSSLSWPSARFVSWVFHRDRRAVLGPYPECGVSP
jgi:hypothetical protein